MTRVGLIAILLIFASFVVGCSEETSSVDPTGIDLRFENCLTFAGQVFLDNDYLITCTSDQSNVILASEGAHTIFVRANIVLDATEQTFCWTRSISVSSGSLTVVVFDCNDAEPCEAP